MAAVRPLSVMLHVLGWAALPCWPAGVASAVWWTGRAEMALLSVAAAGTSSAVTLRVLAWAEARMTARSAEHERLEGKLCDVISDDVSPKRPARTLPDLRLLP